MKKFISTNLRTNPVSVFDAIFQGLAPDGGLFFPETIPTLHSSFFETLSERSLPEIAFEISKVFFEPDVPTEVLHQIAYDSFTFDIPLVRLDNDVFVLELFHGPTCAFKDIGARFMANLFSYFMKRSGEELTILVATSGNTGSAVASAFFGIRSVKVVILYPRGLMSEMQEKQITTLGGNVVAIEIDGTFDDCQDLVKRAFLDKDLHKTSKFASANSINIARLIPQTFYYFYAYALIKKFNLRRNNLVFSVPSGNLGNLTAGVIAKKMGLPIMKLIAAVNANDIFPSYLQTGEFSPRRSVHTLSNAMDIGNPSNFARLRTLYEHLKYNTNGHAMKEDIFSHSFSDKEIAVAIKESAQTFGYVFDPHSAVGYLGLLKFSERHDNDKAMCGVVLATAHPAKFLDTVETITGKTVPIPQQLTGCLTKEKNAIALSNQYEDLKAFLEG